MLFSAKSWSLALVAGCMLALITGCSGSGNSNSKKNDAKAGNNSNSTPDVKLQFDSVSKPVANEAKELNGAGGTFPEPLYRLWFQAYQQKIGVKINYAGVGSGAGIRKISNKDVDFGASDAPMTKEQLDAAGGGILHIPTTLGAVSLSYNVPELKKAGVELKLTPENIAGIFTHEIVKWNDPALVANNPALKDVSEDIITVHRQDGSGTTFVFADYLSTVDAGWQKKIGKGTSIYWPIGVSVDKNGGVAKEIQFNQYSIGYLDLNYAILNKLPSASVRNAAGQFVQPTEKSVTAAAASAEVPSDLRFSLVNAKGQEAYPICTATWILVPKEIKDRAKATAITRMLWWATHEGQAATGPLNYAPLPASVVKQCEVVIKSITSDGKQVWE
jgi:phosphate transport system substrate-binding protein